MNDMTQIRLLLCLCSSHSLSPAVVRATNTHGIHDAVLGVVCHLMHLLRGLPELAAYPTPIPESEQHGRKNIVVLAEEPLYGFVTVFRQAGVLLAVQCPPHTPAKAIISAPHGLR